MTSEERDIYQYLLSSPRAFFSAREIARRAAGKRRYQEEPNWAKPVLPGMVEKGLLERNEAGHFRVIRQEKVRARGRKWVAPRIARILKESGKDFSENATIELEELEESDTNP